MSYVFGSVYIVQRINKLYNRNCEIVFARKLKMNKNGHDSLANEEHFTDRIRMFKTHNNIYSITEQNKAKPNKMSNHVRSISNILIARRTIDYAAKTGQSTMNKTKSKIFMEIFFSLSFYLALSLSPTTLPFHFVSKL